jgi:hypothetical protein
MLNASTARLLQGIEGFTGENAGKKEHETNVALLARIKSELEKGHGSDKATPGMQEAHAAAQRGMPAEQAHSSGDGQAKSNEPGPGLARNEPVVDIHEGSPEERKIQSAGPVPSRGALVTNDSGPAAASGVAEIRKLAAAKEMSRPDSKFPPITKSGDGNKESNLHGDAPANTGRIGNVKAPAKAPPDKNRTGDQFEGTPAFAKESLAGDGFQKAGLKARQMWAKK